MTRPHACVSVSAHVHVPMSDCVHLRVSARVHVSVGPHVHVSVCPHVHVSMSVCLLTQVHHIHVCVTCAQVSVHVRAVCVSMHVCAHMCLSACMYVTVNKSKTTGMVYTKVSTVVILGWRAHFHHCTFCILQTCN